MLPQLKHPPRFVVFEGPDGVGKSTLIAIVARRLKSELPRFEFRTLTFPGEIPRSFGEWVYRFHHGRIHGQPRPGSITPAALQLMHLAAHVDEIDKRVRPSLANPRMVVLLDRFWWSLYAYGRLHLDAKTAWRIADFEKHFWAGLPKPLVFLMLRRRSLSPDQVSPGDFAKLKVYYRELASREREAGGFVIEHWTDHATNRTNPGGSPNESAEFILSIILGCPPGRRKGAWKIR